MRLHAKNYKAFANTLIKGAMEAKLTPEQFDKLVVIVARFFEINTSNFKAVTWIAYCKENNPCHSC